MACKGWLIYDEAGWARNKWFAEHLTECAPKCGLELELKILPTEGQEWREAGAALKDSILQHIINNWEQNVAPDFTIVRVIAPELSEVLEAKGVRVFNNALTARVANNKWMTYEKALQWELPMLKTQLVREEYGCDANVKCGGLSGDMLPYPMVIKAVAGHGGSQVYWAEDAAQQEKILQELYGQGLTTQEIILQKPCSEPGRDMRVYVLGDEIYQAVLRSSDRDFRSNFSLGGEIALTEVTDEQRMIIERLHQKLQFDFVGIDFIFHKGQWILNEIEDVVGTRMLYRLTDRDVVQDYLAYIAAKLRVPFSCVIYE